METKIYILQNLGCANCAAKMEAKINALPQVQAASITFATRQLRVTATDPEGLLEEMEQICRSIEPEVTIVHRQGHPESCGCGHHHEDHGHCGCGHHHEDHGHCGCEHEHHDHAHDHSHGDGENPGSLLLGGGLFLLGLVMEGFGLKWLAIAAFVAGYLLLGWQVLVTAAKNLIRGRVFDENFLMGIATLGAFAIGEFPEAVGVMLFYRVGAFFEHKAVERSRSQIMEAVDLRPETVRLISGEAVRSVPADQVQVGDVMLVRPGDRIPLDGLVLSGESRIDTAPITGEPVPVAVKAGSHVLSGCVNTTGQLTVQVEKPLSESMVTRILNSVESAAASKPRIDRFITRFSRVYTPVVVATAAAVAVIPPLFGGDWSYWVYTALSFLVMSCPCALVLSVPLAFFSGIGTGSKRGILFKGGLSIEAMAGIRAVAMDKTGTLTKGDFSVQRVQGGDEILALCAGCERHSTHPIAQSIVAAAMEKGLSMPAPDSLEEIPGHGIRATVAGRQVLCGNEKLMEKYGVEAGILPMQPGTCVRVAVDGMMVGAIQISDTLKPGAREAVSRLKNMGITAAMLTGDNDQGAKAVAQAVGIDLVYSRLLPQEKLEKLRFIRENHGTTMFVGDGINDAPVLSGADVGAAMGSGADAAIEAADVVFLTSQAEAIPEALDIARQTRRIAWQNVVFALAVKGAVMVLGLCGLASMWLAVFADSGVAMLCVLNSIRLLYKKK